MFLYYQSHICPWMLGLLGVMLYFKTQRVVSFGIGFLMRMWNASCLSKDISTSGNWWMRSLTSDVDRYVCVLFLIDDHTTKG